MKATVETIRTIVSILTADEQQLLKDTIKHGYWGDAGAQFLNGPDTMADIVTDGAEVYITNDAKQGGHFSGPRVSAMFRSIYKKLCPALSNQVGAHLSHCNDWWDDGSGDVLMLREDENSAWREWADEAAPQAADTVTKAVPRAPRFSIWRYDGKAGGYDVEWRGIGNSDSAKYFPSVKEALAWLDSFGWVFGYGQRGVYWLIRESGTKLPPVPSMPQPRTVIEPRIIKNTTSPQPKDWIFQFRTKSGDYLGRVHISSVTMPTIQEAVEAFAKIAPAAAKVVHKQATELITDAEQPLGDVPVGSVVYSNISQRTYQVVNHRKNYTSALYLDGLYKDEFRQFDSNYPVVIKKLGDGKTKKDNTPSGFSVRFVEDGDGVEMMVKKNANANGLATTYTRDQLREIANAINEFLAK